MDKIIITKKDIEQAIARASAELKPYLLATKYNANPDSQKKKN
jgi:hypothetical protein